MGDYATTSAYTLDGDPFAEDPSVQVVENLASWREFLWPAEWAALRLSPTYWGVGVQRGHGEPVVLVPGFFGGDWYLYRLFAWLTSMGYRPYFSGIDFNVDCPDATANEVGWTVRRAVDETGLRARLVGHSLGGLLARAVAAQLPDHVAGVIAVGAPIGEVVRVAPFIERATQALRTLGGSSIAPNLRPSCFSGHCTCEFVRAWMGNGRFPVPRFSIYSKTDGVVAWESCLEADADLNEEVCASHSGMAWNPQVYRAIGRRLAEIGAMEASRGPA